METAKLNDMEHNAIDDESMMTPASTRSLAFLETAALLTIWSLLVINEGAIRFNDTGPALDDLITSRPSKYVLFIAALGEFTFGVIGFYVGIAAFLLKTFNTNVIKASMVIQAVLGYYVFAVYVFSVPILTAIDDEGVRSNGLTDGEADFITVMGLLTSIHFCFALQGGQFIFFARLIATGTGTDFLMQLSGHRMRAMFWNGNIGLAGLWTFITGAFVINRVESGAGKIKVGGPFVGPPHVGRYPIFPLLIGLLVLAFGATGFFLAFSRSPVPKLYYVFAGVIYLGGLLNFGILQFGLIPLNGDEDAAPVGSAAIALHNGLVFMALFLGVYFLHLSSNEDQKEVE